MAAVLIGLLVLALVCAAAEIARLAGEVQRLQGRLAEARAARLDMLVRLDHAAGSAAVLRRERDAVVESAAGVAKLAQLDALHPPASGGRESRGEDLGQDGAIPASSAPCARGAHL